MPIKLSIKQVLYLLLAVFSFSSYASIQISSTRVIYREAEKDVSIQVNNPGGYPVLLQSWMDDGRTDIKPENISSPFILTPPLTRVNANEGQTLRLSYIGKNLPADRESVYWLNVLEIPPVASKESNQIQVAFRSRIKVFYRPTGLEDKAALSAAKSLQWVVQGKQITLTNPTPFYISLLSVSIKANGKTTTVPADMIAPKSSKTFELTQSIAPGQLPGVAVEFINDYGAVTSQSLVQ
ncbi:molecular chaperone [Enterobacter chengduensis]|uniref:fimbrial biogenesis chaperone n=1 Tax=Enterobacter chengduensis TaxID=2494701 RepID=UPI002005E4DF|nr:fimbria/pilus periplasmic chaperone [Enterobacter chengduensis]MCK7430819.1 fimbria/pilus periplasmic chaperone [Enterobacter chengduensis]